MHRNTACRITFSCLHRQRDLEIRLQLAHRQPIMLFMCGYCICSDDEDAVQINAAVAGIQSPISRFVARKRSVTARPTRSSSAITAATATVVMNGGGFGVAAPASPSRPARDLHPVSLRLSIEVVYSLVFV